MASEIKVDTIVNAGGDNDTGIDLATNDQILLKVANATKLTMNSTGQTTIVGEGGTTTTSVQQGLCKAWVNLNGTSTISTRDSFNISGTTDNTTGAYTHAFTNNMNNDDYAFGSCYNGNDYAADRDASDSGDVATSSFKRILTISGTGTQDNDLVLSIVAGDLA